MARGPDGVIRFGAFEADLQTGELRKHSLRIKLREQPFQLLALLLTHPGEMIARGELQRKLWAADTFVDFDRGLNRAVNQLRNALGDSAANPRYIETLPKRGYRFIAVVENATTGDSAGWFSPLSEAAPPERNTVVLTEIENRTGDAAFDFILKQALEICLAQSPFLRILPDQQVADTLRLMGRNPDERLTYPVARELCLRAGGKAVLGGSVSRLGEEYVLGLNALNCQTGEMLAQEQVRAGAKEEVLRALEKGASNLRGKLGESLLSVRHFDRPLNDFVSTSSLEALRAYVNGQKMVQQKGRPYGIPFFRRAADLDVHFAFAYMHLGILYAALGEVTLASENTSKAYALRDQISESERFMISVQYFLEVTGQLEKVPSLCHVWIESYPGDGVAHERASCAYMGLGRHVSAVAEAQQGYRKRGAISVTVNILARSYLLSSRLDDARALIEKSFAQHPDHLFWRQGLYVLGFFDGDARRMDEQVAWAMGMPGAEDHLLALHSDTHAYFGLFEKAREFTRLAVEFAQRNDFHERAALLLAREALREAWFGNTETARRQARAALSLVPGRDVRALAALALARGGEVSEAGRLSDQLEAGFPSSTLIHKYWLPTIRAEIELQGGNHARAIDLLRVTIPNELADTPAPLTPAYLRGEAYLRARQGEAAREQFHRILQNRGLAVNAPVGVLARVGLVRAYILSGETAKARGEYKNLIALWKDADMTIPLLEEAKAFCTDLN